MKCNGSAKLSLISARIAPSPSSFTLVMVFLIGSLQSTLYQVARLVLEYRVDFFSGGGGGGVGLPYETYGDARRLA